MSSSDADSKSHASPVKTAGARPAPPATPLTTSLGRPQATPGQSATLKRALEAQGWTSELALDLAMWFVTVLGNGSAMRDVVTAEDFFERLQTGVELCDLINKVAPEHAVATIARDAKAQSYQAYDNIQSFLDVAKKIGVHDLSLFVLDDLTQRKSDKLVVNTLLQLSDLTSEKNSAVPRVAIREEVRQAFASPQKKAGGASGASGTAVGAGTASDSATHGGAHKSKPSGTYYTAVGAGVATSYAAVGSGAAGGDSATGAGKRHGKSSDASQVGAEGSDDEENGDDGSDDENDENGAGAGGSGSGSGSGSAAAADEARRARRAARRAAREARKCHGGGEGKHRRGGCHKCCKREPDWKNDDKMFFGFLLFATHAVAYYLKRRSGK